MKKSHNLADCALYIEKYIFPFIFLCSSLLHCYTLRIHSQEILHKLTIPSPLSKLNYFVFLSDLLIIIALILFNFLISYALLVSKNLSKKPEGFLELFIPLIATFWFLTYNVIPYLPSDINLLIIPKTLLPLSVVVGSVLTISGLTIASSSIFTLRKSFGIFVQVRDIVTAGPYKYVRHPIYLGHIMAHAGLFFITPRFYALLLSLSLFLITLYRAKLEEQKLVQNSQAYRDYMNKTPFIIPFKIN